MLGTVAGRSDRALGGARGGARPAEGVDQSATFGRPRDARYGTKKRPGDVPPARCYLKH